MRDIPPSSKSKKVKFAIPFKESRQGAYLPSSGLDPLSSHRALHTAV